MSDEPTFEPPVPWSLAELLRDGPAPLSDRPLRGGDLDVVLVLEPGAEAASDAGVPDELVDALERAHCEVTLLGWADAPDAADADVLLACGWGAAAEVLRVEGVRARGVLPGPEEPPLAHLHWTQDLDVVAPAWLGGTLPAAADEAYRQLPTHRADDVVHVHGQDPLALLIAAELAERRPHLEIVVSGMPFPASLPFGATAVEGGAGPVARAFARASIGLAPPVRGWRPVATAMLACGLPVVTADTPAARAAVGDAAALAGTPDAGVAAAELLLDSLELRAERSREGIGQVTTWDAVARAIVQGVAGA